MLQDITNECKMYVQTNYLAKLTPAEVFVLQKGIYTNLCELLRLMLHHFVLKNCLRLEVKEHVVFVSILNQPINEDDEFHVLKLAFKKVRSNCISLSQYILLLQESTDEDELIYRIMLRMKKAGYFKQNVWEWFFRTYTLSAKGNEINRELQLEINSLKKRYEKDLQRDVSKKLSPIIGANQWFITNRIPDELKDFDTFWQKLIADREAARLKEMEIAE